MKQIYETIFKPIPNFLSNRKVDEKQQINKIISIVQTFSALNQKESQKSNNQDGGLEKAKG